MESFFPKQLEKGVFDSPLGFFKKNQAGKVALILQCSAPSKTYHQLSSTLRGQIYSDRFGQKVSQVLSKKPLEGRVPTLSLRTDHATMQSCPLLCF